MKKLTWFLIVITFTVLVGCQNTTEQESEDDADSEEIIEIAEDFITLLSEGQYEEATNYFNRTTKEEFTSETLKEEWDTLNEQIGEFVNQEYSSTTELNGYQVVMINGYFEETVVLFNMSFDKQKKIAGYYIQ